MDSLPQSVRDAIDHGKRRSGPLVADRLQGEYAPEQQQQAETDLAAANAEMRRQTARQLHLANEEAARQARLAEVQFAKELRLQEQAQLLPVAEAAEAKYLASRRAYLADVVIHSTFAGVGGLVLGAVLVAALSID